MSPYITKRELKTHCKNTGNCRMCKYRYAAECAIWVLNTFKCYEAITPENYPDDVLDEFVRTLDGKRLLTRGEVSNGR